MTRWSRWQDWTTVILGVALGVMPFITQTTGETTAAWTAYIMGTLIVLAGLWAASTEKPTGLESIPAILGVIVFIAPWALQFTQVTALAWSAWVVGAFVALTSSYELVVAQSESAPA